MGGDDILATYESGSIRLANGLGSVGVPAIRFEQYVTFKQRGFVFATVIHPSAIVSTHAVLSEGVQVMAGAVVQAGASIGENPIINTNASVGHDCYLEDHIHVAPGATLSGGVHVGRASHIGAGATVIQGIQIGDRCVVGAGAVVVNHIAAQSTVVGVPAKPVDSVQNSKVGGK